ncbi:MAG: Spy/CpxP family protein refolding chaperone [Beijerinckiaceae bacterium]|nr:Spy/CpxP family protein refolding chaperone [Beijerinckiaceae bacterium]
MSEKKPLFGSAASKWMIAGVAVLTIGVGASIADWARDGGGPGPRWGQQRQVGPGPGMARLCERDPLKFEGVARAFLKADLDLTPAQNAELDKLATGLVPALKELRDEMCNNFAVRGASSAPERLEKFASVLRKAADTAEKSVQPAKSFYATLDDKQKSRVEELANRRPPHMRGGPGRHGGPGFDGPPQGQGWFR